MELLISLLIEIIYNNNRERTNKKISLSPHKNYKGSQGIILHIMDTAIFFLKIGFYEICPIVALDEVEVQIGV